jgi:hypothetical protein
MSQFLAKCIRADIFIPLYPLSLDHFFLVFEHFCFLNPALEVVAVILKALFAHAKCYLHHFRCVVNLVDELLEEL